MFVLGDLVATDAAHKLVWQNFPILLVGTVDMAKQFHPTALRISKKEKSADFAFAFKTVPKGQNRKRSRIQNTRDPIQRQPNEMQGGSDTYSMNSDTYSMNLDTFYN